MALQTYTAGQILTAAQQTTLQKNDYNQTVSTKTVSYTLVAADVGTRVVMNSASATTITVNTGLFAAGDTLKIHNIGAGLCTVTAGTATVNSMYGMLQIPQYSSGELYFTSAGVALWFGQQLRMAGGSGYAGSGATVVTMPVGRFSAAMNVVIINADSTATPLISAYSATGVSFTYANSVAANATYFYLAFSGAF
jgi:hypothetical protein